MRLQSFIRMIFPVLFLSTTLISYGESIKEPNLIIRIHSYNKVMGFLKNSLESSGVGTLVPMFMSMATGAKTSNSKYRGLDLDQPLYFKGHMDAKGKTHGAIYLPVKNLKTFRSGFQDSSMLFKQFNVKQVGSQVMLTEKHEKNLKNFEAWSQQATFESENLIEIKVAGAYVESKMVELSSMVPFVAMLAGDMNLMPNLNAVANWVKMAGQSCEELSLTLGVKNKHLRLAIQLVPKKGSQLDKQLSHKSVSLEGLNGLFGSSSGLEMISTFEKDSNQIHAILKLIKGRLSRVLDEKDRVKAIEHINALTKMLLPSQVYSEVSIGTRQRGSLVLLSKTLNSKELNSNLSPLIAFMKKVLGAESPHSLYKKIEHKENKMKVEDVSIHHLHLQMDPESQLMKATDKGKIKINQRVDLYYATHGPYLIWTLNSVSKITDLIQKIKKDKFQGREKMSKGETVFAYELANVMSLFPKDSRRSADYPKFSEGEKLTFGFFSKEKIAMQIEVPEEALSKVMGFLAQSAMRNMMR